MPGGEGSVGYHSVQPFLLPSANLAQAAKTDFFAGKALAVQPWVKSPSSTDARDGLGPLYNARSCVACHERGGRGILPQDKEGLVHQSLVKIALPGTSAQHGVVPDPVYGFQLQTRSISLSHHGFLRSQKNATKKPVGDLPPEAEVRVSWQTVTFEYADGAAVKLRRPSLKITNLGYGDLQKSIRMSLRNAPVLYGGGLLEAIPEAQILANADPMDSDGDGISGRVNRVWNFETKAFALGRFGWKAIRPDLRHITAAAFANDIGITNVLFPSTTCTQKQMACVKLAQIKTGAELELTGELLKLTMHFVANIAVPKAHPLTESAKLGQSLFKQLRCIACHKASYVTVASPENPQLSNQHIWPYTDMLLHDLGDALADPLQEYDAQGNEWRTAPLWGLGASKSVISGRGNLLHDGRAQTIEQAILWHGGEAEGAKQGFVKLPKQSRDALIHFLESI